MVVEKFTLKDFIEKKTPKKLKETKPKKRKGGLADSWFTAGTPTGDSSGASGGIGESLLSELFAGMSGGASPTTLNMRQAPLHGNKDAGMTTYPSADDEYEEEPETKSAKVDQARTLFKELHAQKDITRADIINRMMERIGITNSTAVSYYTRFQKEFGLSSKDDDEDDSQGMGGDDAMGGDDSAAVASEYGTPPPIDAEADLEEPVDPNRAGIIRVVDNAHLVYKRQGDDGTYEELWIFNIHDTTNDELDIRRDILAGTDIPVKKTKSADGVQSYSIITMGNAQLLRLTGLSN